MDARSTAAVALGGVAGATARWGLVELAGDPSGWPWAVFVANLVGCAVMGLLVGGCRPALHTVPLVGLTAGFCGALTTFAAFAVDLAMFLRDDRIPLFVGYLSASLVAGVAAFLLGQRVGTDLARQRVAR